MKIRKLIISFSLLFLFFIITSCKGEEKGKSYIKENDKIYFGKYPQTLVSNVPEYYNELIKTMPKDENTDWKAFPFYKDGSISNYIYYLDLDTNKDDEFDIRAIYLTEYKDQYTIKEEESTIYNNDFELNKIYYFVYEPIEWDIIKEDNKNVLLISNFILDANQFESINKTTKYEHNNKKGYSNNYELSYIRSFLNNDFYNIAFKNYNKSLIINSKINNSSDTFGYTNPNYSADETSDNIFLLSYKEAYNLLKGKNSQAKGTDYSKILGLNKTLRLDSSAWWLRSPYGAYPNYASIVNDDGSISTILDGDTVYYYSLVNDTSIGVRPSLWLKLN